MIGHRYEARVTWSRGNAPFADNQYSRRHEWTFDGGVTVPASSSPAVVPLPFSAPDAVDPEEALVASASSCHMLWFLSLAAGRGLVVDDYTDEAYGVLGRVARGKLAFSRIVLRPDIRFADPRTVDAATVAALHDAAHDRCFIASSLRCDVVVESS